MPVCGSTLAGWLLMTADRRGGARSRRDGRRGRGRRHGCAALLAFLGPGVGSGEHGECSETFESGDERVGVAVGARQTEMEPAC